MNPNKAAFSGKQLDPELFDQLMRRRGEMGLSVHASRELASLNPGMTLREWLVGQVLAGSAGHHKDYVAKRAVAIADAVLAELSKEGDK